jgi:hypothetical protein
MSTLTFVRVVLVGGIILAGEWGHCAQNGDLTGDRSSLSFSLSSHSCERLYERSRFSEADLFSGGQGHVQGMGAVSFYPGLWYLPATITHFYRAGKSDSASFVVGPGQTFASVDSEFRSGALPRLSGKNSFAVEVCYRVSVWSRDYWPAVWMLPVEHNHSRQAHWTDDPERFERWLEIDIDEGGFGPGMAGTAHNWSGDWPNISAYHNINNISTAALDRTQNQCFGVYYDASRLSIDWFLNGTYSHGTGDNFVHPVARLQNFFLIFSNQQHRPSLPGYQMIISKVAAYRC